MNHTSTAVFAITACLIVAAHGDQGLDCRKLIYSRNCRGVAIKRGDVGNGETQSGILRDNLSLRRLMYDLIPAAESSLPGDTSPVRKNEEERMENELHKDKLQLDHLLYRLFMGTKRRNNENDNLPLYEY